MAVLKLKPGREKSVLRRHPWIFSGAAGDVTGAPGSGETVQVQDASGAFLAWAAYSPYSQIRARVWTWNQEETVDREFLRKRLAQALALRAELIDFGDTDACRLVHGESDGLPGLVVDRYGDTLSAQFLSSGPERWREELAGLLLELTGATRLYERSDVEARKLEGLTPRVGPVLGGEPPERIIIREHGLRYGVDLRGGHKTGHYLDQRENRRLIRYLANGRDVLDAFCFTGGFTANALAGGATSVLAMDSSAPALAQLSQNLALNELPVGQAETWEANVFQGLRGLRDRGRSFDLAILDPPKFAPTRGQVERAARAYKDINLLAFKLLRPGGLLVTFSCSGGVNAAEFQSFVAGAALDAGLEAQIIAHLYQGADHPVALSFPEGSYLKGLVIRVAGRRP